MNAEPENTKVRKKENRLLLFHHELFYPAFLGAALFEFARKIFPNGTLHFFEMLLDNGFASFEFIWFASALWFMLYFSVAFLALAEAKPESFPGLAFFANFVEIGVILLATISIERTTDAGAVIGINYTAVYLAWILIPVTAGVSNVCSRRTIHTALSLLALLIGFVGLCLVKERVGGYLALLAVMYVLLARYYYEVFAEHPRSFFVRCNLDPETSRLHRWVERNFNLSVQR